MSETEIEPPVISNVCDIMSIAFQNDAAKCSDGDDGLIIVRPSPAYEQIQAQPWVASKKFCSKMLRQLHLTRALTARSVQLTALRCVSAGCLEESLKAIGLGKGLFD